MFILGLTGPIASGKTTVLEMFEKAGASVLSADKLIHELQQSDFPYAARLAAKIGEEILDAEGCIDRQKLSKKLLENPSVLTILEDTLHPALRSLMKERIEKLTSEKHDFLIILEVPLMYKAGMDKLCDKVATCSCLYETRYKRALERNSMTEEKWQFLNKNQPSGPEVQELADFIINTEISLEEVRKKVVEIIQKTQSLQAEAWEEKWRNIPV